MQPAPNFTARSLYNWPFSPSLITPMLSDSIPALLLDASVNFDSLARIPFSEHDQALSNGKFIRLVVIFSHFVSVS